MNPVELYNESPEFPAVIEYERRQTARRRERIATALAQGILSGNYDPNKYNMDQLPAISIALADQMIKELDKGK